MKNDISPSKSRAARTDAFRFLIRTLFVVGIVSLILSWDSRYADPLKFVIHSGLGYLRLAFSYVF